MFVKFAAKHGVAGFDECGADIRVILGLNAIIAVPLSKAGKYYLEIIQILDVLDPDANRLNNHSPLHLHADALEQFLYFGANLK